MFLKRAHGTEFIALQWLFDLTAVVGGLLLSYWFRFYSGLIPLGGPWDPDLYLRILPWAIVYWMIALKIAGNYRNDPVVITFNRARRMIMGSVLALMMLIVHSYFFRVPDISRIFYPIAFSSVILTLISGRILLQRLILSFLVGSRMQRSRVLIVGLNPTAYRIAARVIRRPEYALDLVGFLTTNNAKVGHEISGRPVFGHVDELRKVIREQSIQDVFITNTEMTQQDLFQYFVDGERETARVHIVPSLTEMMRTTIHYDENLGVPVYQVRETPLQGINVAIKRGFDILISGFGLLILSPVFLLISLLIKRSSPGSAFYLQQRVGLDGQSFTMIKFRTMPEGTEKNGPVWGDRIDHRTEGIGSFLRRMNLDELPQLWNVLRGDMSIVGPRPERNVFAEKLRENIPHYMSRHHVKTGMTGWAQVHGLRGRTSITQRLRYDLYYIENWSLWLDTKILLMTFWSPRRPRIRAISSGIDHYLADSSSKTSGKDMHESAVPAEK